MAFSSAKNGIFFQRLQNLAGAMQNAREEAVRLSAILALEASPSGVDDAAFADTTIATKAAAKSYLGIFGEFENFFSGVAVGAFNRKDLLVPFVDTTPA